jgi:hypothetical protein
MVEMTDLERIEAALIGVYQTPSEREETVKRLEAALLETREDERKRTRAETEAKLRADRFRGGCFV